MAVPLPIYVSAKASWRGCFAGSQGAFVTPTVQSVHALNAFDSWGLNPSKQLRSQPYTVHVSLPEPSILVWCLEAGNEGSLYIK